ARERFLGELRARTNAEDVGVGERFRELAAVERARQRLEMRVARGLERLDRGRVHAFEQHDLDLCAVERGLSHAILGRSVRKKAPILAARAASGPERDRSAE